MLLPIISQRGFRRLAKIELCTSSMSFEIYVCLRRFRRDVHTAPSYEKPRTSAERTSVHESQTVPDRSTPRPPATLRPDAQARTADTATHNRPFGPALTC